MKLLPRLFCDPSPNQRNATHVRLKSILTTGISLLLASSLGCHSKTSSLKEGEGEDLSMTSPERVVLSSRPLDSGAEFRLGSGYDKLSGTRYRRPCLANDGSPLYREVINGTDTDFTIVNSKEDLAKKLNIEVNAEASGSYGLNTGSVSSKTKILKTSNFSDRSLVAIMRYEVTKEILEIDGNPVLTEEDTALLIADPLEFRRKCGDVYTKSVTLGATIYILLNVKFKSSDTVRNVSTENALKVAFGPAFNSSVTTNVSTENQRILSNLEVSTSCVSFGVLADACGGSPTGVDPNDLVRLVTFMADAKAKFSRSVVDNPKEMRVINEYFEDYPKPRAVLSKKRNEVFYDFSANAANVKKILDKELAVNDLCNVKLYASCLDVQIAFAEAIKSCARQDEWVSCDPDAIDIQKIIAESQTSPGIGKVVLWKDFKGGVASNQTMILNFDRPADRLNSFVEGTIYNFSDFGFDNVTTGWESSLKAGYQVRLFENEAGEGRCFLIRMGDAAAHSVARSFNDKASSFRLEKAADYPATCAL